MKTKLLSAFLVVGLVLIGLAVINYSETSDAPERDIAKADVNFKEANKPLQTVNTLGSFFEIFTDQTSSAFNTPDLDITNPLGTAAGYQIDNEGVKTFLRCTTASSGTFQFSDPDQTSYDPGTTYFIDWGDGETSTQVEDHIYDVGLYTLSYTVNFTDGTTSTSNFRVFVGSEPPTVSVDLISGSENCFPDPYFYTIRSSDNQPGTVYTINFNDGSENVILYAEDYPYDTGLDVTLNHVFDSTSCGINSNTSTGDFDNSFAVTVSASNPCSTDGNFVSTGPIRVSEPLEADFIVPAEIACVNTLVNFTDDSYGGTNTNSSGCNSEYGRYWEIAPVGGSTIANGQLGSDDGDPTDWTAWDDGSENLGVLFDIPGYYDITLVTRNNCGESRVTKEICIIPEVISEFTLSQDEACFEDDQIVSTDNTSQAEGCDIEPKYEWEVERTNDDCSTSSPGWEFTNGTGAEDEEPQFRFTSPGVYTIRLEVFVQDILPGETCRDDVYERIITIKDRPRAELDDLTVCQDEPFTIDPDITDCHTTTGTTYSWDFQSSPPASISSSTEQNPEISYNTPGTYTYELTVSNECGSNTYPGEIEVLPPVDVEANGPSEVCIDGPIQLEGSISGGTGNGSWSANVTGGTFSPDAEDLNPVYTPPSGFTGEIIFTLATDNSGTLCSNQEDTHIVDVTPGPEVDAGSYDPLCVDDTLILDGSFGGTASSITWTSSEGGTFDNPNDPTTEFTPPSGFTGSLTLTISTDDPAGSCSATSDSVEIEILPLGEVEPIADLDICNTEETSEVSFSSPNTSETTSFEWEIDANIGLSPVTGSGNLPSFTAENLTEDPIVATVTVTPFITSGNTECAGTPETFTITVNPAPLVMDTTLDLCNGDTFEVTPTSTNGNFIPDGTTYIWENPVSTPAGAVQGGSEETTPQSSISQLIENTTKNSASLVYTVTPILGGCEGAPFTITINYDDEPIIQDVDLDVCSDEEISFTPDDSLAANQIPSGTTYTWSSPSITPSGSISGATEQTSPVATFDQQLTNTTSENATATYTVTPDLDGCEGEPFTIMVDVKPSPFVEDSSLTICSEDSFTFSPQDVLPNRVPSTTLYTWGPPTLSQPGAIVGFTEASSPQSEIEQTLVNTSNQVVTLSYEITPEADGCVGEPFTLEVTVEPKPAVEDFTENICTGGTFSIVPSDGNNNIVPANTTYTWSVPTSNPEGAITGGSAEDTPQTEISQNVSNTSENIATLTYVVTPTSGNCVGEPFTVEIVVESSGTIQEEPAALQTICEGGEIEPLGVALKSGESTSTTYQWFTNTSPTNEGGTEIPDATSSTYLPPAFQNTGTYYFYVIVSPEGDECGDVTSQVSEVEVVEDPTIDTQALDDQDLCFGAVTNQLSVQASGGIGQLTYQWYVNSRDDTTSGSVIPGETSTSFTPETDENGTFFYYVVVSQDTSGCETTSETARIHVEPQPVINQNPESQELCLEAEPNLLSVNLNFSLGSPSYQWFVTNDDENAGGTPISGANQSTYSPSTEEAGEKFYYVEINFDNSSCGPLVSNPARISVVPFAELNPIEDIEVCQGEDIPEINFSTTDPNMIHSYEWTNSNEEIGLEASGTGSIPSFTATNSTSETQTATITVTSRSTFSGESCGESTQQFRISVASEIQDNAVISDFNGNQTSCSDANDGSIQINPSGGIPISSSQPYRYRWSGPNGFSSNQEDIFNLRRGTYQLEVTDGLGCVSEFTYEIEAPEELVVIEDAVINVPCHDDFSGRILISVTGGTGNYEYVWLKNGMIVSSAQDLENIGAGVYSVIVSDQNNCTVVRDFEVTEPTPIQIDVVEKSALVCTNEISIPDNSGMDNLIDEFNGFVNIEVQGGTPQQTGPNQFRYEYEWRNEVDAVISTEKNLTGVGPGLYKVDVYDNLICVASEEVELVMPDSLEVTVDAEDETCAANEDGTIALDIEGGTQPYTIQWDHGETGARLTGLAPGVYTADITDRYNCTETVTVEIEGVNALEMNHVSEDISCYNAADGFVDVNIEGGRRFANGSYDYQWTGPDGFTSTDASLNNLTPGLYTLVARDASGCSLDLEVLIEEPTQLNVSYQTTQANCFGIDDGTITLVVEGGTPPYTSNFGPGDSTFLFEGLEPGVYDIELMDNNGCMEVLEIEIEQNFVNEIDAPTGEPVQEFCIEDQPSLQDLNVQGTDVKWYLSPDDEEALPDDFLIEENTVVFARNFDAELNCLSSETLRVEVIIIEGIIDVNNFITVNGNDLNEKLNVINIELFPENEMKIYNRYGKLVWETTGYDNTGNSFKGAANVGGAINQNNFLPTGTYFYILNYRSPCKNDTKKGFVQIDNNNR